MRMERWAGVPLLLGVSHINFVTEGVRKTPSPSAVSNTPDPRACLLSLLQAKLWTSPDIPGADPLWTRPAHSLEVVLVAESLYPVSLPYPPKVARKSPPSPRRRLWTRGALHSAGSSPLVLVPASLPADRCAQEPHRECAPRQRCSQRTASSGERERLESGC